MLSTRIRTGQNRSNAHTRCDYYYIRTCCAAYARAKGFLLYSILLRKIYTYIIWLKHKLIHIKYMCTHICICYVHAITLRPYVNAYDRLPTCRVLISFDFFFLVFVLLFTLVRVYIIYIYTNIYTRRLNKYTKCCCTFLKS